MTTCPKCNSPNVATGFMGKVLQCESCKWCYLNEYPCSTCGKPSTGVVGIFGEVTYSCTEHSTLKELFA